MSNDGSKSRITGNVLRMLLGFGAAAAWLAIVRYLEYSRKNYVSAFALCLSSSILVRKRVLFAIPLFCYSLFSSRVLYAVAV